MAMNRFIKIFMVFFLVLKIKNGFLIEKKYEPLIFQKVDDALFIVLKKRYGGRHVICPFKK